GLHRDVVQGPAGPKIRRILRGYPQVGAEKKLEHDRLDHRLEAIGDGHGLIRAGIPEVSSVGREGIPAGAAISSLHQDPAPVETPLTLEAHLEGELSAGPARNVDRNVGG